MKMQCLKILVCLFVPSVFASGGGKEFLKNCGDRFLDSPVVLDANQPNDFITYLVWFMNSRVIGQEQAVLEIAQSVEIALERLNDPNKPLGSYLLTGPSGVGKTETLRALVAGLGGSPDDLIRIDCGQDQGDHDLARIKGAPPGTVGYDEIAPLANSQLIKKRIKIRLKNGKTLEINVILMDEIEKGPPGLERLLLGALDHGKMQMANHTETDLTMSLIFGTTNLGSEAVDELIEKKERHLASASSQFLTVEEADLTGRYDLSLANEIAASRRHAVENRFQPEFVGRWEAIISFYHLGSDEYARILQKILAHRQIGVFARGSAKFGLVLGESARRDLLLNGTNRQHGARRLESQVKSKVMATIAHLLSTMQIRDGDVIELDSSGGQISSQKIAKDLSRAELLQFANFEYPDQGMLQAEFDVPFERPQARATIEEQFRNYPEAAVALFEDNAGRPSVRMAASDGFTSTSEARVIKVEGLNYYRLRKVTPELVVVTEMPAIPSNVKNIFAEDKLKSYTKEQLLKFIEDRVAP